MAQLRQQETQSTDRISLLGTRIAQRTAELSDTKRISEELAQLAQELSGTQRRAATAKSDADAKEEQLASLSAQEVSLRRTLQSLQGRITELETAEFIFTDIASATERRDLLVKQTEDLEARAAAAQRSTFSRLETLLRQGEAMIEQLAAARRAALLNNDNNPVSSEDPQERDD